ncbi:unnamed protein product [Amoebophrya sp. A120]|nr:unnamed protein product [Amoebophrya sp. A120]|eukprot:GSA120T00000752001.1
MASQCQARRAIAAQSRPAYVRETSGSALALAPSPSPPANKCAFKPPLPPDGKKSKSGAGGTTGGGYRDRDKQVHLAPRRTFPPTEPQSRASLLDNATDALHSLDRQAILTTIGRLQRSRACLANNAIAPTADGKTTIEEASDDAVSEVKFARAVAGRLVSVCSQEDIVTTCVSVMGNLTAAQNPQDHRMAEPFASEVLHRLGEAHAQEQNPQRLRQSAQFLYRVMRLLLQPPLGENRVSRKPNANLRCGVANATPQAREHDQHDRLRSGGPELSAPKILESCAAEFCRHLERLYEKQLPIPADRFLFLLMLTTAENTSTTRRDRRPTYPSNTGTPPSPPSVISILQQTFAKPAYWEQISFWGDLRPVAPVQPPRRRAECGGAPPRVHGEQDNCSIISGPPTCRSRSHERVQITSPHLHRAKPVDLNNCVLFCMAFAHYMNNVLPDLRPKMPIYEAVFFSSGGGMKDKLQAVGAELPLSVVGTPSLNMDGDALLGKSMRRAMVRMMMSVESAFAVGARAPAQEQFSRTQLLDVMKVLNRALVRIPDWMFERVLYGDLLEVEKGKMGQTIQARKKNPLSKLLAPSQRATLAHIWTTQNLEALRSHGNIKSPDLISRKEETLPVEAGNEALDDECANTVRKLGRLLRDVHCLFFEDATDGDGPDAAGHHEVQRHLRKSENVKTSASAAQAGVTTTPLSVDIFTLHDRNRAPFGSSQSPTSVQQPSTFSDIDWSLLCWSYSAVAMVLDETVSRHQIDDPTRQKKSDLLVTLHAKILQGIPAMLRLAQMVNENEGNKPVDRRVAYFATLPWQEATTSSKAVKNGAAVDSSCRSSESSSCRKDIDMFKSGKIPSDLSSKASALQKDVFRKHIVNAFRMSKHQNKEITLIQEYATDFVLTVDLYCPEHKFAIEVDGPHHFLFDLKADPEQEDLHGATARGGGGAGEEDTELLAGPSRIGEAGQNSSKCLNGRTVFKHALLERRGIRVLSWAFDEKNDQKIKDFAKPYLVSLEMDTKARRPPARDRGGDAHAEKEQNKSATCEASQPLQWMAARSTR